MKTVQNCEFHKGAQDILGLHSSFCKEVTIKIFFLFSPENPPLIFAPLLTIMTAAECRKQTVMYLYYVPLSCAPPPPPQRTL